MKKQHAIQSQQQNASNAPNKRETCAFESPTREVLERNSIAAYVCSPEQIAHTVQKRIKLRKYEITTLGGHGKIASDNVPRNKATSGTSYGAGR